MASALRRLLKLLVLAALFLGSLALFSVRPLVFAPPAEVSCPKAKPDRIKESVRELSVDWAPRDFREPSHLADVADRIFGTFRENNARVSLQTYLAEGAAFHNVVSEYGFPTPGGTVVVGAHYDTVPDVPGADDNASGVAAIFELGRIFSEQPPPVRVLLVAYALEELPFFGTESMGSAVHASSLKRARERVRLMISLDSIGYYDTAPGSQRYPWGPLAWIYPSAGDFVAIVGPPSLSGATLALKRAFAAGGSVRAFSLNAPDVLEGLGSSDHKSFWRSGYDAVMITDTAMFRNPFYHSAQDGAGTLDYTRIAGVTDAIAQYVMGLGEHTKGGS